MTTSPIPENALLVRDAANSRWLLFENPREIVQTCHVGAIVEKLHYLESSVEGRGLHAAGFLSYEAAPGFDTAFAVRGGDASGFPLLWFGLYDSPREFTLPPVSDQASGPSPSWEASMTPGAYARAFDSIKHYIQEGDTYQVNLTYRLRRRFLGDPWESFLQMASAQSADYGAYVTTPRWTVCCASPELFFRLEGSRLESRPMKGTAPRGLTAGQDRDNAAALRASEKNGAENLMIVDMVRNDMGRVSTPGSVETTEILTLEKYPTVWQMTSKVVSETHAPISEIVGALFPPASITGAPKSSTLKIIAEVETSPRRIYTGSIGFFSPGRKAQFNVAIRTLLVDQERAEAEYGVGGGIVWDSECLAEQAECRTKARILNTPMPTFFLLESMLWTPTGGYALLARHLSRLEASAGYFNFTLDLESIGLKLAAFAGTLGPSPHKVRLLVAREGSITLEASPIVIPEHPAPYPVQIACRPVDRNDLFLYHKTTHRKVYADVLEANKGQDDVILWNADGEVTESTRANVVAEIGGVLCTPPVSCGILAGTFRAELLETGDVVERVITVEELLRSPRVMLVNSVRGMMPVTVCRSRSR